MSTKSFKSLAGVLTLAGAGCFLAVSMRAQPMYDRIHVNLPYTVTLQNKTLQPGDYTIQQLPNSGGGDSRILLFYTKDGMKFETSAMTIPTLDPETARDTKMILNHVGEDYYISKIWVQGKDYGYELPVPDALKSRQNERMSQTSVPATYQPSASTEPDKSSTVSTTTATAVTPPAASTEAAPAANTPATTTTATSTSTTTPATADVAQNTQPPAQPDNSADRAMPDQPAAPDRTTMPSTSAGWLTMLLSGGTLSGVGLMLRRKR
jgi:hypothetical protein